MPFEDLQETYDAFWMLNSSRPVLFGGIGHIPLTEISAYIDLFDPDDVPFFIECIRELDNLLVRTENEKAARKSKAKTPRRK